MAQDPFGLVFRGQEGTGAAYIMPQTSYDPYKAAVEQGQAKLKMLEAKKKKEAEDKEEALKLASYKPPSWSSDNVAFATSINSDIQNALTGAFAKGDTEGGKRLATEASAVARGFTENSNKQYNLFNQAQQRVNTLDNALKEVAYQNFAVYSNPNLASPEDYPEVYNAYQEELQKVQAAYKNTPWLSPESIQAIAVTNTRDRVGNLLDVPKSYDKKMWFPTLLAQARYAVEKQGEVTGDKKTVTQTLTFEKAKELTQSYWNNDYRLQREQKRIFKELSPEQRGKYENAQDWFVNTIGKELEKADREEFMRGKINIYNSNVGGAGATTYNAEGILEGGFTGFGFVSEGEAQTSVPFSYGSGSIIRADQMGELKGIQVNSFVPVERSLGGLETYFTGRAESRTAPADFKFVDYRYRPVATRDVETKGGKVVVKKGDIITKETANLINKTGTQVAKDKIAWKLFAEGTVSYEKDGKKTEEYAYVPWSEIKPKIASQLIAGKKISQWKDPQPPTEDVFEKLGITPATTTTTRTTTTPTGATGTISTGTVR
jgi:hypothetical protein